MLARFYSEDPGSARRGGEYGFTGRGELTPEFANVIFNMTDPKKISKVFETEYGYHIAQLIEKRGDRVSYRHILMKPKVDEAEIEEALNKLDTLANDIRKGKVTFDEAATWVSQDKDTKTIMDCWLIRRLVHHALKCSTWQDLFLRKWQKW